MAAAVTLRVNELNALFAEAAERRLQVHIETTETRNIMDWATQMRLRVRITKEVT